jgi:hypothetical protein
LTPRLIGKCTQRKHAKAWSIDCVFHEVNHHCIIKAMLIFNSVLGFRSFGGSLWRNRWGKLPWASLPITWLRFNFLVLKHDSCHEFATCVTKIVTYILYILGTVLSGDIYGPLMSWSLQNLFVWLPLLGVLTAVVRPDFSLIIKNKAK